jgi:hypothetical protein
MLSKKRFTSAPPRHPYCSIDMRFVCVLQVLKFGNGLWGSGYLPLRHAIPDRIFPCNRPSIKRSSIYSSAITVSRELSAVYAEGCSADDSADDGVWKCCRVKVLQMTESGVGAE